MSAVSAMMTEEREHNPNRGFELLACHKTFCSLPHHQFLRMKWYSEEAGRQMLHDAMFGCGVGSFGKVRIAFLPCRCCWCWLRTQETCFVYLSMAVGDAGYEDRYRPPL